MRELQVKYPQPYRRHPIGLYIETKMVNFYQDTYGIDVVQLVYNKLVARDLNTIALAVANGLPIITESFEEKGNRDMAALTDLPVIRLMNEWDGNQAAGLLADIATYAHGIGPRQDLWRYPHFRDITRSVRLQVHPWTMQDDKLHGTIDIVAEFNFYWESGCNAVFTEYPHSMATVFNHHAMFHAPPYDGLFPDLS
jgi:glycerophosphoryl diester phosphodiesterase